MSMGGYLFVIDMDTDGTLPTKYKMKLRGNNIVITLPEARLQLVIGIKDLEQLLHERKQRKKI